MSRLLLIILIMSYCIMSYCASAQAITIGEAKKLGDGTPVSLSNVIATDGWEAGSGIIKVYVQEQNRSAGIAIYIPEASIEDGEPGMIMNLSGQMDTVDGERCVNVTDSERLPGLDMPKPLGIPNFGNWQGLNPGGLYIRTWGVVTESPNYAGGAYLSYFRFNDGSGDIKAVNLDAMYGPVLQPLAGERVAFSAVCSPTEKAIFFRPQHEVSLLGTINFFRGGLRGWTDIRCGDSQPTAMYVSGPGTEGWQLGWQEGEKWSCSWPMPDPLPTMPAEYQFLFIESGRTRYYKGWITGYVNGYPTNLSPVDGASITGTDPVTFSWTPPAGGPFSTSVQIWKNNPTFEDLGRFEVNSGTSFTYPGQLEAGEYTWQAELFRSDDNGCISSATLYYNYDPGNPPPPPPF